MRRLHTDGYNVLAITCAAHGDSDGSVIDFGYSSYADVVAAVDFLNQQLPDRPVVVCGTSPALWPARSRRSSSGRACTGTCSNRRTRTSTSPRATGSISTSRSGWRTPLWGTAGCGRRRGCRRRRSRSRPLDAASAIPLSVPVAILSGARDRLALPSESRAIYDRVKSHGTLVSIAADSGSTYDASSMGGPTVRLDANTCASGSASPRCAIASTQASTRPSAEPPTVSPWRRRRSGAQRTA